MSENKVSDLLLSNCLRDVRHEDIPEINNPHIRFPVLEGEKVIKDLVQVEKCSSCTTSKF